MDRFSIISPKALTKVEVKLKGHFLNWIVLLKRRKIWKNKYTLKKMMTAFSILVEFILYSINNIANPDE